MKLKNLSIFTGILFVISIFVFINENKRGTDLLSGSDYVKGLDVNNIQKIILSFKEDKKLILNRDGNHFFLENHKSYPAASDKINDLIYKIASIKVEKKVTSSVKEDDLKKYELDAKSRQYTIELFDNNGKKTVSFRVGKSDKGGSYLFKEGDKDVYLSQNSVRFNSSYKNFIDTILLDVKSDDIEKISLKSNIQIEIVKKDKDFVVEKSGNKKFKKEKIDEYSKKFTSLRFDDFYSHSDSEVQALNFSKKVTLWLKTKLMYEISLAKKKKDYFVKMSAGVEAEHQNIIVNKDDGEEKLKDIGDVIEARTSAQRFNMEKGRWVYKINKSLYEKLIKNSKFFL